MALERLGILGAGQLGKMLCQKASEWNLHTTLLDKSVDFPAGRLGHNFIQGDFTKAEEVAQLIGHCDRVTIEIEKVSTEGLKRLRDTGIIVHPSIEALEIIKDKGLQKNFYAQKGYPSSDYQLLDSEDEVRSGFSSGELSFPLVLKSRTGGYDGRGVQVLRASSDLEELIPGPYVVEELVDIEKELAVIAVANERGDVRSFPIVEMIFDPVANLVDYLLCPSQISPEIEHRARSMAEQLIKDMGISGLLSVELFLTKAGDILINEVAPRPHNSGHHTIEACNHSQYEMHLRGVMDWPLPEVQLVRPAAMINLLGSGQIGAAQLSGWQELLQHPNVYPHIYGKELSKPYRKMGHITITGRNIDEVENLSRRVKNVLSVTGLG